MSEALTLILKLVKLLSSKIFMFVKALSIRASGQGDLYFSNNFFSKEPALTPILIDVLLSLAAWITDLILSEEPIFPGFNLRHAAPASAASMALL